MYSLQKDPLVRYLKFYIAHKLLRNITDTEGEWLSLSAFIGMVDVKVHIIQIIITYTLK